MGESVKVIGQKKSSNIKIVCCAMAGMIDEDIMNKILKDE